MIIKHFNYHNQVLKTIFDSLNLGIRELIAVLIPGSIMCFFIMIMLKGYHWSISTFEYIENSWLMGFLFFTMAYFLGYTIYSFSSFLDKEYDKIKRRALELDKGRNVNNKLSYIYPEKFEINSYVLRKLFPHLHDTHNLIVKVVQFKNRDIGEELDGDRHQTINAYQYAFRRLMTENELVFAEVESYFSTARFFRSMSFVLFFGTIIWAFRGDPKNYAIGVGIACIVSFFVFLNRWRKANHVALKNLIILEGTKKLQS